MNNSIYENNLSYYKNIRSYDLMTPKERAHALSIGAPVDRMPVYMMADLVIPQLIGTTLRESELSAKRKAEVQIAGYRMFGFDSVGMMHGLYSLPIAIGGAYSDPENLTRTLIEYPVKDISDLSVLDLDCVGLCKDEAASKAFDAIRYVQEAIGDEVECTMNFTSPFTVASGIVGIEKFLTALAKNTERAEQVLQFVLEAQFKLAKEFLKEGITVGTSDPVASCTIINPKLYRKFAQPYEIEFAKRCMEYMGKPLSIHICGNTTKILNDVADCGFSTFSLDNMVDLAVAKREIGNRMHLAGNVDPVAVMLQGTPRDVEKSVHSCYFKAWDSPKGFSIHTGCDMPYGTPLENMEVYLREAKKCAKEHAEALLKEKDYYIWDDAAEVENEKI
ncbi:uroporphyrinogen decarboxylase [Faecalicatena contorta]|uniref:Uroporphyrinogen decarboxylase n=2 Tax=Faecalicatena contorta TaxID=39482 RepID=A0A316A1Y3_9FIRM|nr:uroporphyrinogen decarboxylase [Faecalicatena contorta]SUQ12224.1 uroporphyrinogen decarboxylase [Faecalicatena contorta]